jgi:hypothetical protein
MNNKKSVTSFLNRRKHTSGVPAAEAPVEEARPVQGFNTEANLPARTRDIINELTYARIIPRNVMEQETGGANSGYHAVMWEDRSNLAKPSATLFLESRAPGVVGPAEHIKPVDFNHLATRALGAARPPDTIVLRTAATSAAKMEAKQMMLDFLRPLGPAAPDGRRAKIILREVLVRPPVPEHDNKVEITFSVQVIPPAEPVMTANALRDAMQDRKSVV